MSVCVCLLWYAFVGETTFCKSVLYFYYMYFRGWSWVFRLSWKHLYPLSHLGIPRLIFLKLLILKWQSSCKLKNCLLLLFWCVQVLNEAKNWITSFEWNYWALRLSTESLNKLNVLLRKLGENKRIYILMY